MCTKHMKLHISKCQITNCDRIMIHVSKEMRSNINLAIKTPYACEGFEGNPPSYMYKAGEF